VGITARNAPSRRITTHAPSSIAPSRTSAYDTSRYPSTSASAADPTATAGSSHHTASGPVSAGNEAYCHQPMPAAAAAVTSSTHAIRRRRINATATSPTAIPAPT
jgi:hypothetical protein